ncbi:innexin shaking-B [Parasteatoda tepidariorum]|uniref:Innexin n=1 Tax=Parasteatoda tepidariorum TaxID=114398 RepID=A0A2L2YNL8_PARTP|nr:innexin shaking-B [Parasteatoda tepidariorum]XP_021000021.1 innexin shaking-B [Parasteatoda tepidariorum]XP_021000022.1 innexin shaking-B [Parasteatoda tepidariorum]
MLDLFRSVKGLVKVSRTKIDNEVFRLHYTFTVLCLVTFCIVVTTKQYVGDPIQCAHSREFASEIMNTYCWIHTTYTIPSAYQKKVGTDIPHPGIDSTPDESKFRYHKYYQWVCFMLFFQATLFYIPRWLWRMWEGGKIQALMMDLDIGLLGEAEKKAKKKLLVDYLMCSWKTHDWYAGRYLICEILCFINVVGQMFLLNKFFDGEFWEYGLEVIHFASMDPEERMDPMIRIFPRVTKCRFMKYGPSGNIEKYDALCVMPLNIINEKIYIFLWFWFVVLAILSGFVLIFHMVLFACPPVRVYVLSMRFRFAHMENLHMLVRKGSFGDWFLIYMLGQNVDSMIFKEIVVEVAHKVTSEPKESL